MSDSWDGTLFGKPVEFTQSRPARGDMIMGESVKMDAKLWQTCQDPQVMLQNLRVLAGVRLSLRKQRLIGSAACRLVWDKLTPCSCDMVLAVEKWADGRGVHGLLPQDGSDRWNHAALLNCDPTGGYDLGLILHNARDEGDRQSQADLLREMLGNPFAPLEWRCKCGAVVRVAEWRRWYRCDTCSEMQPCMDAGAVRALAIAAYQERREDGTLDPLSLKVLADALEEDGCPQEVPEERDVTVSVWRTSEGWHVGVVEQGNLTRPRFTSRRREDVAEWAETTFGVASWSFVDAHSQQGPGTVAEQVPHPLLAHLRSDGPHYRGCWALDLLLGKE